MVVAADRRRETRVLEQVDGDETSTHRSLVSLRSMGRNPPDYLHLPTLKVCFCHDFECFPDDWPPLAATSNDLSICFQAGPEYTFDEIALFEQMTIIKQGDGKDDLSIHRPIRFGRFDPRLTQIHQRDSALQVQATIPFDQDVHYNATVRVQLDGVSLLVRRRDGEERHDPVQLSVRRCELQHDLPNAAILLQHQSLYQTQQDLLALAICTSLFVGLLVKYVSSKTKEFANDGGVLDPELENRRRGRVRSQDDESRATLEDGEEYV